MSRIGATTALADPQLMSWDTEFWGLPIAKADRAHVDIDQWAADNTVGLMWLLIPSDRPEEAQEAEGRGWRFMDVRVELERPTVAMSGGLEPHRDGDVEALVQIARTSHRITRFYADPTLDDERCDDLYEHWIRNSCAGWADSVIVTRTGGLPAGYITVHVDGDASSIGLIAVDLDRRRAGMGFALVQNAVGAAHAAGASRMSVVTQGRNVAAQRLFQKCGFRTTRTDLWFHKRYA